MQQGMLFHSLHEQQPGYYIEQLVCHLHEALKLPILWQSWQQVVERHPVLRTSFSLDTANQPCQVVCEQVQLPIIQQDWREQSKAEQAGKLKNYLQRDRQTNFDFAAAPLMRLALFQLGEADYTLVWTFHHALLDGRSIASVLQEVFTIYDAYCSNQNCSLPERRPYQDYIEWLEQQSFAAAENFWREMLREFTTPTQLPTLKHNPKAGDESLRYERQKIQLSAELTTALQKLAQEQQLTLNTLVQGAWAILLSRYSGEADVVFGATRACRYSSVEGMESAIGLFINTVPVRAQISSETEILPWLQALRSQWLTLRDYEHTPLVKIQEWSEVPGGTSLFDSILVFDRAELGATMRSLGGAWENREFELLEQMHYPLVLNACDGSALTLKIHFDRHKFDKDAIGRMLRHLETLLQSFAANCQQRVVELPLLTDAEKQQLLIDWNKTEIAFFQDRCIHQLFEQQVSLNPDAIAVAFEDRQLTYQELNAKANQLARYLQLQGVSPDALVGLHVERSLEMMVALLGIHKAGGAYVPLDPDFPPDRISFMLQDSQAAAIVTQQKLIANLVVEPNVRIIPIDTMWDEIAQQAIANPDSGVKPENLSYVIYTSGSTGKPKGVMVEHRNAVNFFTGMDGAIEHDPPGVWLAVTSLSFDISVLELFWTLARGFKVVIYDTKQERAASIAKQLSLPNASKSIDFSLFYFSSYENGEDAAAKYRLLTEGTQFGDLNGFKAVWTPERHFHAFGGLFPNPAITSAAIASTTKQIQIRAGSCVSPLHSSVRIAEDWSVVDNLSGGRVGISFAAGWQPNDFVLRPETFGNRKDIMFQQIEEVRSLWRGESVTYPNGKGEAVAVQTLPRPIQPELPVWITAAGNPETFRMAGAKGFHILTHLLGQSLDELAEKIALYRQAWAENGHSGKGTVTLMLHTFVGQSDDTVREIVRQPMRQYLATSLDLIKQAAWAFPTFKQKTTDDKGQFTVSHLSERDLDEVLDFSFERYFETSGLFGTVETCVQMVDRIKGIDVDEIACLIDYGVETDVVLSQLPLLDRVKVQSNLQSATETPIQNNSVAALIERHQVTHLQCTPSMAGLLIADTATREAMKQLRNMMVGGEAFTEALALQLQQIVAGQIHNMYGPTETAIWSATHTLAEVDGVVPIGRPIANTELYILDKHGQPVPVGVAGELFIGGKGVTRGYLNRPELTQERFIPNPFSQNSADRLYRTGDLVRYRMDGNLEFLGRMDFQVKLRGYRIELGEIETILSRHETVREVAIVVREDVPGDKRLVAYVLPQPGKQPSHVALREYLLDRLPEYMVPSNFVMLEAFPLTPNNKVDRKALPAPTMMQLDEAIVRTAAPNQIEQTLMAIWQKLLQVSEVGTGDNFFSLGGNSLIAVSLMGTIRSTFDVDLPLMSLFQFPTVGGMARQIEKAQAMQANPDDLEDAIEYLAQLSDEEVMALLKNSEYSPFGREASYGIRNSESGIHCDL
jgi:natural product biosynthesis luciferase-like monooxygenase protein